MTGQDQIFGHEGEQWVFEQLKAKGYHPRFDPNFYTPGQDIICNGLPVEVKIAHRTYRRRNGRSYPRWQWFIHPTSHAMDGEWILILIAEDSTGKRHPYILPGSVIEHRSHLQLTSHPDVYRGWLARFRNQWSMVDYLTREIYKQQQGPLFDEWAGRVAA